MSLVRTFSALALSLGLGGMAPVVAQTADAPPPPPSASGFSGGRVTVMGVGEIQAAPDMVSIVVEVVKNDGSPVDASADARKAMNTVLAAARRVVPLANDLKTTRISINPEYEWTDGKRKFRGYVASQSLEITLRELPRLDSLLEYLNKSQFTSLGNLDFRHSKSDSLQREARVLALRNAADNAKSLCAAAGRSCDELTGVRAGGAMGPGPMPMMEFKAMRADASGSAMPVQPGSMSFSASVEADYRLK
jgi:uncharacterized protein YggE